MSVNCSFRSWINKSFLFLFWKEWENSVSRGKQRFRVDSTIKIAWLILQTHFWEWIWAVQIRTTILSTKLLLNIGSVRLLLQRINRLENLVKRVISGSGLTKNPTWGLPQFWRVITMAVPITVLKMTFDFEKFN